MPQPQMTLGIPIKSVNMFVLDQEEHSLVIVQCFAPLMNMETPIFHKTILKMSTLFFILIVQQKVKGVFDF